MNSECLERERNATDGRAVQVRPRWVLVTSAYLHRVRTGDESEQFVTTA
jgi:hypothetical protein